MTTQQRLRAVHYLLFKGNLEPNEHNVLIDYFNKTVPEFDHIIAVEKILDNHPIHDSIAVALS